ncbi:hypothetical protein BD779DRAFT_1803122 [Infundibulicybe gibba]|nr:hypothetical protein BD779DRAFT_1803122 [Infundibulicybe gibba]
MSTIINILSIVWLRLTIFASYFRLSLSRRVAGLSLKGEGLGLEDYGKVFSLRIRGRKVALFITGKYKSAQILTAFIVANLHLPSSRKVPEAVLIAWADVEKADQGPPVPMKELAAARISYFYPASTHEVTKTSTKYANVKQEPVVFTEQNTHPAEADGRPASIVKITPAVSESIQDTDQVQSFISKSGLLPLNPPLVRSSLSRLAYPESQDTPLATIDFIVNAPQPEAVDPRPGACALPHSDLPSSLCTETEAHALAVLERKKLAASMDNGSAFFEETHGEDNLSATAYFPVSFPAEDLQETTEALDEGTPTETIAPTSITLEISELGLPPPLDVDTLWIPTISDPSTPHTRCTEDEDADDEGDDIDNVSEYSELDAMECDDEFMRQDLAPDDVSECMLLSSSELDMDGVLGCDDLASVCLEPHLTMREIPSLSFNAQGNATHEWDPSPILDYIRTPQLAYGSCSSYSSGSSASSISPPPTPTFTQFPAPRTPSLVKATKPQARDIFAGFRSRLSNIHWTDFIPDDDSDDESGDEDHEWVPPTREWPFNEPEDVRPQADIFIIGDCSDEE